jgi:hypothetical protein
MRVSLDMYASELAYPHPQHADDIFDAAVRNIHIIHHRGISQ